MSASKEYTNGEVIIEWKPGLCIHSANCVKGLPGVFDTKKRPWINPERASTEDIIAQVKKCPSGALSTKINSMNKNNNETSTTRITITDNGPVLVNGQFQVHDANGKPIETAETIALCRCGASGNKPFCDGTHHQTGFKG